MQFHLVDGKNVRWTDEQRTRLAMDVLRSRFQSKRFFQTGLTFEAEMFDMRNKVKRTHMRGRYRIVSDLDKFWQNFGREIKRMFSRVDGEAKNLDYSILEIRIGDQTFYRRKFETDNESRIVLVLTFNKLKEPTPL